MLVRGCGNILFLAEGWKGLESLRPLPSKEIFKSEAGKKGFSPALFSFCQRSMTVGLWITFAIQSFTSFAETLEIHRTNSSFQGAVVVHQSVVEADSISHVSGVVTANITAGDGNVQQNSTALANSQGYSQAVVEADQFSTFSTSNFYQVLSARIASGAFNDAFGIAMVNQSSGAGNVQFNGAAIAVGGSGAAAYIQLNNDALGEQSASTANSDDGNPVGVTAEAYLDPDAFKNARGVMMINQAVGNNNATANSFTLSVSQ